MEPSTPIQYLKGVGPKLAKVLERKGINTLEDLLYLYPRSYRDYRACQSIQQLKPRENVSLVATVVNVHFFHHIRIWEVTLKDHSGYIKCKYFKQPYRGYFDRFQQDMKVRVEGKVSFYRGQKEFHHPDILDYTEQKNTHQIIPLYVDMDPISHKKLLRMIETALEILKGQIQDPIPEWLREEYHLMFKETALRNLHIPDISMAQALMNEISPAHKRVKFEEFFWVQLIGLARKSLTSYKKSFVIDQDSQPLQDKALELLKITLTSAQERVFLEIKQDLKRPRPMHRLIQGDVYSGFLSCSAYYSERLSGSLYGPSEVLAEQHYQNAILLFASMNIEVTLLTEGLKKSERIKRLEKIKTGASKLCIGTHALIQEDVEFKKLALSIIDEQHRFGVHQRRQLKVKGSHLLVMTATPIPRSLSMTLYGDLDISIIDQMPLGRQSVITRMVKQYQRPKVIEFIRQQLRQGRQAYVIYPLVEESEKKEFLKDARSEFEVLKEEFKEFSLGLIHGKLKSSEKEIIMDDFRKGKISMLVSTTVIEVGTDVSNANLIKI